MSESASAFEGNLSEILFKPHRTSPETSVISNSGCPLPDITLSDQNALGFAPNWYRCINRLYWTWLGGNLLDIDDALARIAVSESRRSRETCLDTVVEYGPGNWIYEFNYIAQQRVQQAKQCEDASRRAHHYRMAARYFAIASFPNLKGDVLADQSALLSRRSYREIFQASPELGFYSEEVFEYKGHKISSFLHSPDNTSLHPCVVVLCTYEQSATEFFRIFNDYFRPRGIAILVLDMPGAGSCSQIKLDVHCSEYLKAAIKHLQDKVPFIDSTNIGIMAGNMACLPACRLCIMEPGLIKAMVCTNPIVDSVFVSSEALSQVPLCLRSSLANRMDLDASNWDLLIPQIQVFSLKKQGLMSAASGCKVPVLINYVKDLKYTRADARLLSNAFRNSSTCELKKGGFSVSTFRVLTQITDFFCDNFGLPH